LDPKLNNKLGNKEFPAKKAVLQLSQAWLDDLIVDAPVWGGAQIEQRTEALASLAFDKVWKI
jgi:hypothetical protein